VNGRLVYLDSSAFIKLVVAESESQPLRSYLDVSRVPIAAALLRTEVLRASARVSPAHAAKARRMLAGISLIDLDRELLDYAGELNPFEMRSLDAIHMAAALSLEDELEDFVTYDRLLADAARDWGLNVVAPV
jgi:predicted nucleic acid-binding protein